MQKRDEQLMRGTRVLLLKRARIERGKALLDYTMSG